MTNELRILQSKSKRKRPVVDPTLELDHIGRTSKCSEEKKLQCDITSFLRCLRLRFSEGRWSWSHSEFMCDYSTLCRRQTLQKKRNWFCVDFITCPRCLVSALILLHSIGFVRVCRTSALRTPASQPTTRPDATPPSSLWTESSLRRWEPSWTSWKLTTASGEGVHSQTLPEGVHVNVQLDQVLFRSRTGNFSEVDSKENMGLDDWQTVYWFMNTVSGD